MLQEFVSTVLRRLTLQQSKAVSNSQQATEELFENKKQHTEHRMKVLHGFYVVGPVALLVELRSNSGRLV
eukprot:scaffold1954_cov364-Prasinococcus_capsulatus_cf.AAC.15